MGYSELFKNYADIRSFMRRFYVYGFEKRSEFTGKSVRRYDDERRRLESWLQDYMGFTTDAAGRAYYITLDAALISHNPLYKSWKAKSFTPMDIVLHFYLLDILADGAARTAPELLELVCARYLDRFEGEVRYPDESTVRNKLNEYTELGLLQRLKEGRKNLYRLQQDAVDWQSWQAACAFFSEAAPLGEIGSYILDKFALPKGAFAFKHHFILYTLDSQICCALLEAMRQKQAVTLFSSSGRLHYVCPLKLYCSTQTGRQYLLSYNYAARALAFNRLDHIERLQIKRAEPDYAAYLQQAEAAAAHIWGASLGRGRLEQIAFTVQAAADEQFIVQRLQREKRCGTVQRLDEAHYRFEAVVYDARELLPWLRTFIGRISDFYCSNGLVQQLFAEDLQLMANSYMQEEAQDADR